MLYLTIMRTVLCVQILETNNKIISVTRNKLMFVWKVSEPQKHAQVRKYVIQAQNN